MNLNLAMSSRKSRGGTCSQSSQD